MDFKKLAQLKGQLKGLIADNKIEAAIEALKNELPSSSNRFNLLIRFQQEYISISELRWKNIESNDGLSIKISKLVDNFLEFVDILEEEDFGIPGGGTSSRKSKTGNVMYSIPSRMEMGKEKKCIVRLAFDEVYLKEFLQQNGASHIEALRRIEERMEVELIDPNSEKVFEIRTINSIQQIVEEDDYTEWIYYVKPLREGVFELYLKVTVIICDKGKKEIVMHERVEVTTFALEEKAVGTHMKHSGLIFFVAFPGGIATGEGAENASPLVERTTMDVVQKGIWSHLGTKVAAFIGGIALIGGLYLFLPGNLEILTGFGDEHIEQVEEIRPLFAKQEIQPPISELNISPHRFMIDPNKDTTIILLSGSRFLIPAGGFVDAAGQSILSRVEIRIREFRTAGEIIAGGIPMRHFDEGGKESWMQTAGMFEVRGFTDGQAVEVAEGEKITVQFATDEEGDFDFWFFDEESGEWVAEGSNIPATENSGVHTTERKESAPVKPQLPSIRPVIGDPEKILPPLKIDYQNFPELKEFRDLEWEYAGSGPANNPRNDPSFFEPWNNIIIRKEKGDNYQLSFTRPGDTLVVPVRPCFRRQQGLKEFEKKLEDYTQKLKAYEQYLEDRNNLEKQEQARKAYRKSQFAMVRTMEISRFGFYNYDYLIQLNEAVPLLSDFDFNDRIPDHLKSEVIIYLITGHGRSVITFPAPAWSRFSFLPTQDNMLLALLPDGSVAVFDQEDFDREKEDIISARNKYYRFKMKILPNKLNALEDLKNVIG